MTDQDIELLKLKVKNYKDVVTGPPNNIPESHLSRFFIIKMEDLVSFLDNNPDAVGVRVYLSKETNNAGTEDYQFILMPCMAQPGVPGDYQDNTDGNVKITGVPCKFPPGCNFTGAKLL